MDFENLLAKHPWIAVLAAGVLGILIGLVISLVRWFRKRRSTSRVVVAEAEVSSGPGLFDLLQGVAQRCPCAGRCAGQSPCKTYLSKAIFVSSLALITLASDFAAIGWAVRLQTRLGEIKGNMLGDRERILVDQCMRDFEGLQPDDPKYLSQKRACIEELEGAEELSWLPDIRPTVDEQVCDPETLCASAPDSSRCLDSGDPMDAGFRPGVVTNCYNLIDEAKRGRDHSERMRLLDKVEEQCTGSGVWDSYPQKVYLHYCMWKHSSTGVCMNSMRTNCPEDTSCCPIAQNYAAGDGTRVVRPNQYVCQKSPLVGLYCQQVDFRVAGNFSSEQDRPLCQDVSCPSFAWCRELADVPGQCLGEVCQLYQRCFDLVQGMLACVGIAIILDMADIVVLLRFPRKQKVKAALNATGAALRLVAYLFFVAGGLRDFAAQASAAACFNAAGNARVDEAKFSVDASGGAALVAMLGSMAMWYMSVRWGGQLVGLPHAKGHYQSP